MTQYVKKFDGPRYLADDDAIEEIKMYLNKKAWQILREEADKVKTVEDWIALDRAINFCGIQGYPCHAFGRRYCLTAYREWMLSGDDPIETDKHGFRLENNNV